MPVIMKSAKILSEVQRVSCAVVSVERERKRTHSRMCLTKAFLPPRSLSLNAMI